MSWLVHEGEERREEVSNEQRAQELQDLIRRAERQLAMLSKIPEEDTYPDGTILRVIIVSNYDDKQFTYVLLKVASPLGSGAPARWYHTGSRGRVSASRANGVFHGWAQVQEWLQSQRNVVSLDVMVPQSERDEARRVAEGIAQSEFEGHGQDWREMVPWKVES